MASDYAGVESNTLPGTNQIIPAGTKYGPNVTSRSNKVQAGQVPKTQSAPAGSPSPADPLGLQS